jgi:hypothetical protein
MNTASNTTTLSYSGIVIGSDKGEPPVKTPKELLVTRAVEVKDGWLGQVVMDGEIVWETPGWEKAEEALGAANVQVREAFKKLIVGVNATEPGGKGPGGYA